MLRLFTHALLIEPHTPLAVCDGAATPLDCGIWDSVTDSGLWP